MNQQHFDKWTDMAKSMQEPFKAIAELNVKTIQGLTYLKPEELSQIKKPEEILEKQMSLVVENGHKALDYLQQSFKIIENFVEKAKQNLK